jgi:hypothetical protein
MNFGTHSPSLSPPLDFSSQNTKAEWVNFSSAPCGPSPPCCVIVYCYPSNYQLCSYVNYGRFFNKTAPPTTSAPASTIAGLVVGLVLGLVVLPITIGCVVDRRRKAAQAAAAKAVPTYVTVMPGAVMFGAAPAPGASGAWPPPPPPTPTPTPHQPGVAMLPVTARLTLPGAYPPPPGYGAPYPPSPSLG